MAANMGFCLARQVCLRNLRYFGIKHQKLTYSSTSENLNNEQNLKNANVDFETPLELRINEEQEIKNTSEKPETFASMLRKSTAMMIGDLKGARLIGHIMEVQDNDLYIDFGGKFYCVCQRPEPKSEYYKGRTVDILLHDWEMTSKFIGSEKHTTLLEADATLLGLSKLRTKTEKKGIQTQDVSSDVNVTQPHELELESESAN